MTLYTPAAVYGAGQELPKTQVSPNTFCFVKSLYMPDSSIGKHKIMTFSYLANKTAKKCLCHTVVMDKGQNKVGLRICNS